MQQDRPAADPLKTHLAREFKHGDKLFACRFDPTGRYVFAASTDFSILRWDLDSGQQAVLKGHDSWVRALAFSPDGKTLYSGGYDGRLIWWEADADSPQPLRTVEAHAGWVRSVAVSPDGQTLCTAGNDHLVKLFSAADGSLVRELAGHARHVYNAVFHPGGGQLVSMDLMAQVRVWNLSDGSVARELKLDTLHKFDQTFRADMGGARGMCFSPDQKTLAIAGLTNVTNAFAGQTDPAVSLIDWEKGEQVRVLLSKDNVRGICWNIHWHPAGFLIGGVGSGAGLLLFWKPDQERSFHQVKLPQVIYDSALHPDGLHVATASYDGALRIYKMAEKAPQEPAK